MLIRGSRQEGGQPNQVPFPHPISDGPREIRFYGVNIKLCIRCSKVTQLVFSKTEEFHILHEIVNSY